MDNINLVIPGKLLLKANEIVDSLITREEVEDRRVIICDQIHFPNRFRIDCITAFDYQCYDFLINEDDTLQYLGMEGNFRDCD